MEKKAGGNYFCLSFAETIHQLANDNGKEVINSWTIAVD